MIHNTTTLREIPDFGRATLKVVRHLVKNETAVVRYPTSVGLR